MTEFTQRVSILCPKAMKDDANQLALVMGENSHDDQTFEHVTHQDEDGNKYLISSTVVTGTFATRASSQLVAPAHAPDADLVAAGRAQAALYIYGVHGTHGASTDTLWAYIEAAPGDPATAWALAGVTLIEDDDPLE